MALKLSKEDSSTSALKATDYDDITVTKEQVRQKVTEMV